MLRPTALLLLLLSTASLAQTAAPTPPPETPVYGPSHIRNDDLHFTFDLPEGVRSRTDIAEHTTLSFTQKSPTGDKCITLPVVAFDPKVVRRIFVYRYNGSCFADGVTRERLRASAAASLKGILHHSGPESMTSPIDYELASHHAAVVSGNVYSAENHGILFGETACVAVAQDMLCWAFISSTAARTARLAALPITFDGEPSTPVISGDVSGFVALPTLTYRDDLRHIEFNYPGSFASSKTRAVDILQEKSNEANDKAKKTLSCMKILLAADDLEDDDEHSNLLVYSFDASCSGLTASASTLRDLAKGIVKGFAKTMPNKVEKPEMYAMGERDAALMQGELYPPSKPVTYIVEACTFTAGNFVCWQITSTAYERLRSLAAMPISFDGKLGEPLVPAGLLRKAPQSEQSQP